MVAVHDDEIVAASSAFLNYSMGSEGFGDQENADRCVRRTFQPSNERTIDIAVVYERTSHMVPRRFDEDGVAC